MSETSFYQSKHHEVHAYQHIEGLEQPESIKAPITPGHWVVLPNDACRPIVLPPHAFSYLFRSSDDIPVVAISENID